MTRRGIGRGLVVAGALTLGLIAPVPAVAQSDAATKLDVQIKDALATCYQCHGPGGVSIIPSRPSIAGQKAEYVRRQLLAFKVASGAMAQDQDGDGDDHSSIADLPGRTDPVMEHMAAGLPDQLLAPVAQAVSQLACDGGKPKKAPLRRLTRPRAANKCVICHGMDGIGTQGYIPNLAGQQRSYLRRQLLLIRETAWGAQPREGEAWRSHPIMEAQAARIKIADVDAIARYYAQMDCNGSAESSGAATGLSGFE